MIDSTDGEVRLLLKTQSCIFTRLVRCSSAYYGAVYGMQVVGNWLSCPRHWAPERRKLHHTHYCANICRRKSTEIRCESNKDISDAKSLFTSTEILTAQVSTVYSKIQRCKRFGGHNFPTWKQKVPLLTIVYCLYRYPLVHHTVKSYAACSCCWVKGQVPTVDTMEKHKFLNRPWKR